MKKDIFGLTVIILILGTFISSIAPWPMYPVFKERPDKKVVETSSSVSPSLNVNPMSVDVTSLIGYNNIQASAYNKNIQRDMDSLYALNGSRPLWIDQNGPYAIYNEALEEMKNSWKHGLQPEAYSISSIEKQVKRLTNSNANPDSIAVLDLAITANYLRFNYDVAQGRIDPNALSGYWHKDLQRTDLTEQLLAANTSEKLADHLKSLFPANRDYNQLTYYLERYSEIAEAGGWTSIEGHLDDVIEPGTEHPMIPQIRKRIEYTDSLFTSPSLETFGAFSNPEFFVEYVHYDSLLYSEDLEQAVKRFQERHGLQVDGRIGEETIQTLNISAQEKVETIMLNLERMRWIPKDLGENYIKVNIPSFTLEAYEKDELQLKMKVIVGSEYTFTPVFSDTLKYLVFSPTWTVPYSIKINEMLPRLKNNPNYYSGRNYKFYSGWSKDEVDPSNVNWSEYASNEFPFNVVQQPGPSNSLGLVKFIMPNNMSIYLHDTPTDYLFAKHNRALSHGCIRVEQPKVLAAYLLRDQTKWDENSISEYMYRRHPVSVNLKKEYHVQITYLTAYVDQDGQINFRPDIYGHDKIQSESIFASNTSTKKDTEDIE